MNQTGSYGKDGTFTGGRMKLFGAYRLIGPGWTVLINILPS